ncbi:MAG: signal recognition particle subunit Srp54 [Amphiamblys sp. WSBS2006]|nr:MAG: signal recognition particle subunit Srp54 [Amphiamblys sp. WSBS2006]
MVLGQIGEKIARSLEGLTFQTKVNEKELDEALRVISRSLLQADINIRTVARIREKVRKRVTASDLPESANRKKIATKAVFEELVDMLDPKTQAYRPRKNKLNTIMFVGLQGAGKTTSCSKLANYYRRRGWKTGLVCADTFRPGAHAQLKQNAEKTKTPFFGQENADDECEIARKGVEHFRESKYEIVIVDTSGRNRQEENLFANISRLEKETRPDHVILLMDATTGQAASDQAAAFAGAVEVGSIFLTKTDTNAKCGGALSGIAATGCPISFLGTGEHMNDIEHFSPRQFVSAMLGGFSVEQLAEKVAAIEQEDKEQMEEMLKRNRMIFRDLQVQLKVIDEIGAMKNILSMLPQNMRSSAVKELETMEKYSRLFCVLFSSMTKKEMGMDAKEFTKEGGRVARVSVGTGIPPAEIAEMMAFCRKFSAMLKKIASSGMLKHGAGGVSPDALMKQLGGRL